MNENLQIARDEYLRKLKEGEIERTKNKTPFEKWKENKKSLRLSINAFCFECIGEIKPEITNCTATDCPLWHVRPYQKKENK